MLAAFVREHWRAYAAAGAMLSCIAVLTVWIPRQVGHVVDDLVAGGLQGPALLRQLGLLVLAGVVIYLLRAGWRLTLFKASFQLGARLRTVHADEARGSALDARDHRLERRLVKRQCAQLL